MRELLKAELSPEAQELLRRVEDCQKHCRENGIDIALIASYSTLPGRRASISMGEGSKRRLLRMVEMLKASVENSQE